MSKVDFTAVAVEESKNALYVVIEDGKKKKGFWIPKSVIHDDSEVYDVVDNRRGKLVIKRWWAEKEGLI